jgi:hypothetical protein
MAAMQNTLTIEGLDADTFERLESEANRRGVAVSALARTLLQQSVDASAAIHHDLDALAGTWSQEEAAAFDATTAGMRRIDAELWR